MPEKENVRQRYQQDLFDQGVSQRVYRVVDEDAAVIEGDDLDARGKTGLDLVDLHFDGRDHLARVGPVADDDDSADRLLAIFIEHAAAELRPKLHAGDITHRDGRAVIGAKRNVFDVL